MHCWRQRGAGQNGKLGGSVSATFLHRVTTLGSDARGTCKTCGAFGFRPQCLSSRRPVQFKRAVAHEARFASRKVTFSRPTPARHFSDEQFLKTRADGRVADTPQAGERSRSRRCSFVLERKPPLFPTPDGMTFLRQRAVRARRRMLALYPDASSRANRWRLSRAPGIEINTIVQMGFPGYFLIVSDFINWARAGVPVGPGRGSGAVRWSPIPRHLDLDPLRYGCSALPESGGYPCRTSTRTCRRDRVITSGARSDDRSRSSAMAPRRPMSAGSWNGTTAAPTSWQN
jgi:hypothetical protein